VPATYQTSPLAQARAPTLISAAGLLCFRRASQSEGRPSSVRSCPPWLAPACAPCLLACCPPASPRRWRPASIWLCLPSRTAQFSFLFIYVPFISLLHLQSIILYLFIHSLTQSLTQSICQFSTEARIRVGCRRVLALSPPSSAQRYSTSLHLTPLPLICCAVAILCPSSAGVWTASSVSVTRDLRNKEKECPYLSLSSILGCPQRHTSTL
jgi:hypothetical protein